MRTRAGYSAETLFFQFRQGNRDDRYGAAHAFQSLDQPFGILILFRYDEDRREGMSLQEQPVLQEFLGEHVQHFCLAIEFHRGLKGVGVPEGEDHIRDDGVGPRKLSQFPIGVAVPQPHPGQGWQAPVQGDPDIHDSQVVLQVFGRFLPEFHLPAGFLQLGLSFSPQEHEVIRTDSGLNDLQEPCLHQFLQAFLDVAQAGASKMPTQDLGSGQYLRDPAGPEDAPVPASQFRHGMAPGVWWSVRRYSTALCGVFARRGDTPGGDARGR